ncbi:MAG TPA: helix-turn-helix domain-containing protein [Candidatus Dormibacteraeota bacterium]
MFSLHIRGHLYPAVEALLERLSSRRGEMAEDMLAALRRDVATYSQADGEELRALRLHCSEHVEAFLATTRTGRVPSGRAVEFVQEMGARGARDRVELEVLLRGYRTNAATLMHWVGEQASATTPEGLRAALAVTRMVMEYTDSVSGALAEAFVRESSRLLAEAGSLQRDLLEDMLAGRSGAAMEARTRAAGLEPGAALQVAVAAAGDLGRAVEAVDHQLRMARVGGLRVARHDELVIVAPAEASLRQLLGRAAAREPLAAGISLPLSALAEIPRAHGEARRALALAPAGGILRLADLTLLDYLLAEADDTARRLGPSGVDRLDAPLRETVLAYAASDFNVGATARRLHLHPNTVHYRLGRVERMTGRNVRHFADVVDLVAALRLRSADPGVE